MNPWKRKRRGLFGGSILPRWRYRDNGTDGLGGGTAGTNLPVSEPDTPPVNGGPDRDIASMSNATVDLPPDSSGVSDPTQTQTQRQTPADPNQAVGNLTPSPAAPAADQWQGILDVARGQGFQFDHTVTDDRTALNFLLRQATANRQADVYAQVGRQLAPHAGQIQQYLQQQQQPQAPAARQPWEAPEFNEKWVNLVEQDPGSGMYVAKQGVPHEIAQKVNEFVEWKRNYDRNPAAVINGMVEARSREIARSTFQEQFAAQQREQSVQSIVAENSQWLYQRDAGGNPLRDYMGNPTPTPIGAAYIQQLQAVRQMGVTDPRQQDALAKQLVRGQLALAAQQQAQATATQNADPQTQQAVHQPNRNPLQAQPPSQRRGNPAATEPDEAGLSLMERMRRNFAAEAVTDADIAASAGA